MKRWPAFAVLFALGVAVGSTCWNWSSAQDPKLPPPPIAPAAPPLPKELSSYRDLVKTILPAVVSLEAKAKAGVKKPRVVVPDNRQLPEEFRRFFDSQEPDTTPKLGFGSGFFVDPKGVILTNYHVVEGADTVIVTLNDGRKLTATKIKGDPRTDLAIVVVDAGAKNFPYLEMGDSDNYEIGDRVLAVGAPFGLAGSVTHGIISAKGRNGLSMNMYEDFIQTDAAINPGNSGGPLVGLDGKVVGINAAIKSRSGGFQGIGLAVASNLAKNVVKALQTDGVVRRGYLGVQIRDLAPEVAARFGLERDQGVLIGSVFENTPAGKSGLKAGDIIVSVAGKSPRDGKSLQMIVANLPISKASKFEVVRDGRKMTVDVTIEEQPRDFGSAGVPAPRIPAVQDRASVSVEKVGLEIADLNAEMAEDLGLRAGTKGVVITRVLANSIASEAGLRRGMVILQVEKKNVETAKAAQEALAAGSLQTGMLLKVESPQSGVGFFILKEGGAQ